MSELGHRMRTRQIWSCYLRGMPNVARLSQPLLPGISRATSHSGLRDVSFNAPSAPTSRQQPLCDDVSMHVGQSEVPALEAEGELGVVEALWVQDGGVQVVDSVFGGLKCRGGDRVAMTVTA